MTNILNNLSASFRLNFESPLPYITQRWSDSFSTFAFWLPCNDKHHCYDKQHCRVSQFVYVSGLHYENYWVITICDLEDIHQMVQGQLSHGSTPVAIPSMNQRVYRLNNPLRLLNDVSFVHFPSTGTVVTSCHFVSVTVVAVEAGFTEIF